MLVGEDLSAREVRWVHTSEIFEISPLLKGGEALFTTGLGLVGAGDGAIDDYIVSLAAQGVAALVLEVGRTFVSLPGQFIASARAHSLPLIVLRQMIPFVEITETVHPLLINRDITRMRRREEALRELSAGVTGGDDLARAVELTGHLCAAPVGLYSSGGQLLAGTDVRAHAGALTEIPVGPEPWATLAVAAAETASAVPVAEVGAWVAAVLLSQKITGSPSRALAVSDLLADIATGRFREEGELVRRAESVGFMRNPDRRLLAVAVELTQAARTGLKIVVARVRRLFGASLVAEQDGRIVAVIQVPPNRSVVPGLLDLAAGIDADLSGGGQVVRLVTGPPVGEFTGLAGAITHALHGAKLAGRLGFSSRVITDRDLGLYDLLARSVPDADLERFVDGQLGPLLQADARKGYRLVETLSVYLESGRSKAAAAAALGISRQTMYQRLERIASLLGNVDLSGHAELVSLDLAVAAWRMRTSGLTR